MDLSGFTHGVDPRQYIIIRGARQHNLKNISLDLPKRKINVITGPSGSGKSSLAFNTIFAEGQRRYMESLSAYARQFLVRMDKPDVDYLGGLAPAIAIEQKALSRNPRSTVATQTEIYDYLRLLYAQIGQTISPVSGEVVTRDTPRSVATQLARCWEEGTRFYLAFPLDDTATVDALLQRGYTRLLSTAAKGPPAVMALDQVSPGMPFRTAYVVQDRLVVRRGDEGNATRIADSVEHAFKAGGGRCVAVQAMGEYALLAFSQHFERDGMTFEEPTAHLFSFNSPMGACAACKGFGRRKELRADLVFSKPWLSLREGAARCFAVPPPDLRSMHTELLHIAQWARINVNRPYKHLRESDKMMLWEGFGTYPGIRALLEDMGAPSASKAKRALYNRYVGYDVCSHCGGSRLRREARHVQIGGLHIGQVLELTTRDARTFFAELKLTPFEQEVAAVLLGELRNRLRFLVEVGLGYLTLDRLSQTLSGGESQRINLAASLGSSLVGSLYVLDEPTIGLHPRDTSRLIRILQRLRDLGNTVIVVEHDALVMQHADEIVDLGPGSGHKGGRITFQGSFEEMLQSSASLTGDYLSLRKRIPVLARRHRPHPSRAVVIERARSHNLKRIDVAFPLGCLTVVTGVSGSGKSTLVCDTLYQGLRALKGQFVLRKAVGLHDRILGHELVDRVEMVDQSPIGRSSRSNAATYSGAFDGIRKIFAGTHHAKLRGYKPGVFSFNVDGGRCEACAGDGAIRVEMQFLADLYLECEECRGRRFKDEVLEICYKGKNIDDVLQLTVDEAIDFFSGKRSVVSRLKTLSTIGLGYLKLGQPATTLSGGEAQRVKLATHLGSSLKEQVLYIFDEPTTGLHFDDIRKLLAALNRLMEQGHSVVVIEHNMDIIKAADWIIDLGPEGGFAGGCVVVTGTPEEVAKHEESHTARFLREALTKENPYHAVTF